MKNFVIKASLIFVAVIILMTLPFSFYVVDPNEYAALFKFGKIVSVTDTPGIKYKVPGIHTVKYISKKCKLTKIQYQKV